jgi:hypothetical protein
MYGRQARENVTNLILALRRNMQLVPANVLLRQNYTRPALGSPASRCSPIPECVLKSRRESVCNRVENLCTDFCVLKCDICSSLANVVERQSLHSRYQLGAPSKK